MSTYKYGSYALAHENVTAASFSGHVLTLPRLRWLGLNNCQLNVHPKDERTTDGEVTIDAQGLMRLTVRDRRKARQMLAGEVCAEQGPQPDWRRGLQVMLMLNVKAEMQVLEERPGGISGWLKDALESGQAEQGWARGGCSSVAQIGATGSDDGLLF
jgi:meiotic recombination protein SPO11